MTLGQLPHLVGYRSLAKGARRIACLEQTGTVTPDLLGNVAEALDLNWATLERLAEENGLDRLRKWEGWASEPVPIQRVIRLMSAVSTKKTLPSVIETPVEAEAWACEFARQHRCRECLVLSRRQSVWIDVSVLVEARTDTSPGQPNMPIMEVRGQRFLLEG